MFKQIYTIFNKKREKFIRRLSDKHFSDFNKRGYRYEWDHITTYSENPDFLKRLSNSFDKCDQIEYFIDNNHIEFHWYANESKSNVNLTYRYSGEDGKPTFYLYMYNLNVCQDIYMDEDKYYEYMKPIMDSIERLQSNYNKSLKMLNN